MVSIGIFFSEELNSLQQFVLIQFWSNELINWQIFVTLDWITIFLVVSLLSTVLCCLTWRPSLSMVPKLANRLTVWNKAFQQKFNDLSYRYMAHATIMLDHQPTFSLWISCTFTFSTFASCWFTVYTLYTALKNLVSNVFTMKIFHKFIKPAWSVAHWRLSFPFWCYSSTDSFSSSWTPYSKMLAAFGFSMKWNPWLFSSSVSQQVRNQCPISFDWSTELTLYLI